MPDSSHRVKVCSGTTAPKPGVVAPQLARWASEKNSLKSASPRTLYASMPYCSPSAEAGAAGANAAMVKSAISQGLFTVGSSWAWGWARNDSA
ncbi:hypothetical protein D3C78_1751870 [compost metagenome]